jgi:hypothetical protein
MGKGEPSVGRDAVAVACALFGRGLTDAAIAQASFNTKERRGGRSRRVVVRAKKGSRERAIVGPLAASRCTLTIRDGFLEG